MAAPTITQMALRMMALWATSRGCTLSKGLAEDLRARWTSTMGRKISSDPITANVGGAHVPPAGADF